MMMVPGRRQKFSGAKLTVYIQHNLHENIQTHHTNMVPIKKLIFITVGN